MHLKKIVKGNVVNLKKVIKAVFLRLKIDPSNQTFSQFSCHKQLIYFKRSKRNFKKKH